MRTAMQELRAMFAHFYSADVELRSIGGDVTEVWVVSGQQEEEAQPIKLGLIYGDEQITKVEWLDPETGEPDTLLNKRLSRRLLFLMEHLGKFLYETGVQIDATTQPYVVVNDIYADLSFDETPPDSLVARFIATENGRVWTVRD